MSTSNAYSHRNGCTPFLPCMHRGTLITTYVCITRDAVHLQCARLLHLSSQWRSVSSHCDLNQNTLGDYIIFSRRIFVQQSAC